MFAFCRFILDLSTFVAKSALSQLCALGGTVWQNLVEEARKHFNGPGPMGHHVVQIKRSFFQNTFHTVSLLQESPISIFGLLDLKAFSHLLIEIFP